MNPDYEKVIEFFSEHETAIYGFGPTDDGAEEGIINILSAYGQSVGGETHEQNENNGS